MSDFEFGDRVDITITGARFEKTYTEGDGGDATAVAQVAIDQADGTTYYLTLPLKWEGVSLEQSVPSQWPPRVDDLWRDATGIVWFAVQSDDRIVRLVNSKPGIAWLPNTVWSDYGPLKLVHREEASES